MSYEVWLGDPYGRRIVLLDKISALAAEKVTNNVGVLSLALPSIYDQYVRLDSVIELWRNGKLFDAYLIRKWQFTGDGSVDETRIVAYNGVSLLDRRIVAYAAGTSQSRMSGRADDMMKEIIRYATTSLAADVDRSWSSYGFSVDADFSKAPSISMAFAYRNVLDVLYDIAEASRRAGTRLYFDVVPTPLESGLLGWTFKTYVGQPGSDRTGANQVVFSPEFGNLANPELTFDHTGERNVVYAGGRGEETDRIVIEAEDTTRSKQSPWARTEMFYNCSGQAETAEQVADAGESELSSHKPLTTLRGDLVDSPSARFGIDWAFGDLVVISYRGYQHSAIINKVTLQLDRNGNETLRAGFEVVNE